MKRLILGMALGIVAIAPALADPADISRVNGSITADAGNEYGKLSTVNGSIRIESEASTGPVSTVNGTIVIADGARNGSLETVNGAIRAGDAVQVAGDVTTVNGAIVFGAGSRIDGSVASTNGQITLAGTEVAGDIRSGNGGVDLGPGTRVDGGLTVAEAPRRLISWGRSESREPLIVIGPDSEVRGRLVFKRDVRLHVHESARIGEVEGAEPQRFSGTRP